MEKLSAEDSANENESTPVEINEAENTADKTNETKKKGTFIKDVIEIIESTIATVFVIVLIFTYILHPVNIVGRSMVPTLNKNFNGEREIKGETDKVFMNTVFFDVKYGDILVIDKDKNYLLDDSGKPYQPQYDMPINECIIKRVIAVGGQTVSIENGKVTVDGEVLDEPYIAEDAYTQDEGAFGDQYPITVPEGYYFVMGDNRNNSTDSRARSVGLVKRDQIYGKAIVKYSPLDEFDILIGSHKG
ncbi:MAG: signal peptidase I [Ruminococcus sp.]|nr:signal peptidase I [Ruminococcus sp.]